MWLSLVERLLWEQDAAGSNPVIRTIKPRKVFTFLGLIFSIETGFEPIAAELSGGQFLPPVQTLVATLIFAERKCISNPVIRTIKAERAFALSAFIFLLGLDQIMSFVRIRT